MFFNKIMSENDYRTIIATNIKHFREKNNLSQERFADLVGYHRTYIGSIERCERNLTLETLYTIAEYMKISIPQLLTAETN